MLPKGEGCVGVCGGMVLRERPLMRPGQRLSPTRRWKMECRNASHGQHVIRFSGILARGEALTTVITEASMQQLPAVVKIQSLRSTGA